MGNGELSININQVLVQAQAADDAADWSLLTQYLQQLILETDSQHPKIVKNREYLLKLALAVLEMGDFQQRWEITKVLVQLQDIAIPPLIEILDDAEIEEELRWYAARILGEFPHPDVIAALIEVLKADEDEELKAIAATALGQMGTIAITPLTTLLKESDTRILAVRSLGCIRQTEAITPLLSVVQDPQPAIRVAAIEALSNFHDQRVPPVLVKALDDIAATVRRAAVMGLGFRPDLCSELNLVTKLQPRLYDFNLEVCCAAAVSLSRMNNNDAAKTLFQVLISSPTPIPLQLEIIRALGWMNASSSLVYLQQALNHNSSEIIWQEIATVLGRVQKPLATEILLEMLQSKHPATKVGSVSVKNAIALSLGQLNYPQAIEPLILLLADTDASVRLHAIAALKNLAGETAQQRLQELAKDTTLPLDIKQGIAIALAEW